MNPPPPPRRGTRPSLRRDHPTATAFIDETGAISHDRFFAIGVAKSTVPAKVLRRVQKLRDRRHWYKEFKFNQITAGTLDLYKALADAALDGDHLDFFCFVADRDHADPIDRFGSPWDAYAKLAEQLVVAVIRPDELLSVMADNYSTPDHILFEEDLQAGVNRRLNRLALTSVVRLDSRSSDGLQVVDLLTSAAAFEFRAAAGLASKTNAKAELAEYIRGKLGTTTCLQGWRSSHHSVQVFGGG